MSNFVHIKNILKSDKWKNRHKGLIEKFIIDNEQSTNSHAGVKVDENIGNFKHKII